MINRSSPPASHRVKVEIGPSPDHPADEETGEPTPLGHLQAALDNLVGAGILASDRRPNIEYPIWAGVHGLAVLLRGPLRSLPEREKTRLETQMLAFTGAAVSQARG